MTPWRLGYMSGAGHLFRYVTNQPPKANSAFHPFGVGKWVPASAGKAKAGIVHSASGWTRGVQVKLWDSLRTCAIPERLRGVFTTRRYTNTRLPLPLPLPIVTPERYLEECVCVCVCVCVCSYLNCRLHLLTFICPIQVTVGTGCGRWALMTSLRRLWSYSHWKWRNIRLSSSRCSAWTTSPSSTNWTRSSTSKLSTVRTNWTALSGCGHLRSTPPSRHRLVEIRVCQIVVTLQKKYCIFHSIMCVYA